MFRLVSIGSIILTMWKHKLKQPGGSIRILDIRLKQSLSEDHRGLLMVLNIREACLKPEKLYLSQTRG